MDDEKQVTNSFSVADNSREPRPPAYSTGIGRRTDGCLAGTMVTHMQQITNGGWKATTSCSGQSVENGGLPHRVPPLLCTFFVSVLISSHAIA